MITQADREREAEHNRRLMVAEADADHAYRKRLQAIKDRIDLCGDEAEKSLNPEEKELVARHHEWFHPEEV